MVRTQIYLSEQEAELLEEESRRTGASKSELIRRAVRARYGRLDSQDKLEALRRSAGVWKDRHLTGAEYVDMVRGDVNERLRRLGLDDG